MLAHSPAPTTEAITGKVTDAATGAPLANVCAYVYFTRTALTPSYSACTAADGSYEMDGVIPNALQAVNSLDTSHYLVQFVDPSGAHATQWYNNTPGGAASESGGNAIQLQGQLGTAITGINAVMGVGTASPTVTVSGVPNPATTGPVSYSVLVTGAGATPTGSVSVSDGQGGSCIIASLGSGSGSCSITENASGSPYTVTGTYSGDANYSSGTSTTAETVNPATPTLTLKASPGPRHQRRRLGHLCGNGLRRGGRAHGVGRGLRRRRGQLHHLSAYLGVGQLRDHRGSRRVHGDGELLR